MTDPRKAKDTKVVRKEARKRIIIVYWRCKKECGWLRKPCEGEQNVMKNYGRVVNLRKR